MLIIHHLLKLCAHLEEKISCLYIRSKTSVVCLYYSSLRSAVCHGLVLQYDTNNVPALSVGGSCIKYSRLDFCNTQDCFTQLLKNINLYKMQRIFVFVCVKILYLVTNNIKKLKGHPVCYKIIHSLKIKITSYTYQ